MSREYAAQQADQEERHRREGIKPSLLFALLGRAKVVASPEAIAAKPATSVKSNAERQAAFRARQRAKKDPATSANAPGRDGFTDATTGEKP